MEMCIDFDEFFAKYDLGSLKEKFLENEFSSFLALTEVSDDDLKEIGVKAMGKRKQFLAAIKDVTRKSLQVENRIIDVANKSKTEFHQDRIDTVVDIEMPKLSEPKPRSNEPPSKRRLDVQFEEDEFSCTPKKQSGSTSSTPSSSLKNWLVSPINPDKILESKKIHLYTEVEVKKVYGLRRKKMEFMNNKLRELMKDPNIRAKNKTIIMGMAEVSWDHFSAIDAKIDIIQVDSLMKALENRGSKYNEKQTKTIKKDSERLNRAQSDIKVQLHRIKMAKETSYTSEQEKFSRITQNEEELVKMQHELQKATDALRKACGVKILELSQILQSLEEKEAEDSNTFLFSQESTDEEIEENIINDMKNSCEGVNVSDDNE
ncbi:uncharacterized protein MCAP_0864-like [Mytilus edulis]|uniref:uncharacterized protein MCAP_0864-like n=1 Tax=Mytilus edulis TaxID=6550 RepID=UPI0039EF70EC